VKDALAFLLLRVGRQPVWIEEETMALVGLAVTLFGFLVAAGSVGLSSSTGARLVLVLAGIAISLFGIMGLINPTYQKNATWNR
jgi:hypothetical protein